MLDPTQKYYELTWTTLVEQIWTFLNTGLTNKTKPKTRTPQKFQTPILHYTQQCDSPIYNYKYLLYQTKNILLIFFFRWRLMTIMILVFIAESLKKNTSKYFNFKDKEGKICCCTWIINTGNHPVLVNYLCDSCRMQNFSISQKRHSSKVRSFILEELT